MFKQLFDFSVYQHYGDISTVIFFVLFVGIVARVLFLKKPFVTRMSNLPLDSTDADAIKDGE